MKLSPKPKRKKKIIIFTLIGVVIIAVVAGGSWYYLQHQRSSSTTRPAGSIDYSAPTEDEQKAAQQQKDQIIKDQEKTNQDQPTTDQNLSVTIIRTFQDPTGVNIRTVVGGTTSGNCEVTFSQGQSSFIKTFPISFEATSANCQNTPVSASDFPTPGSWNIKIIVKEGSRQSTPVTGSVAVVK